jgi:hypothetical protein
VAFVTKARDRAEKGLTRAAAVQWGLIGLGVIAFIVLGRHSTAMVLGLVAALVVLLVGGGAYVRAALGETERYRRERHGALRPSTPT